MLTMEQLNEIEYFRQATFGGHEYTIKDYLYKSEVYRDGKLYARINNRLAIDDMNRLEMISPETEGSESK